MGEESGAAEEHVRLAPCELLEALEEGGVDVLGSKVVDQMVVVNCNLFSPRQVDKAKVLINITARLCTRHFVHFPPFLRSPPLRSRRRPARARARALERNAQRRGVEQDRRGVSY